MVYEVVHCAECGKPIKSVPSWLGSVNVKFSCEACRQKHPRPFLGPDTVAPARSGRRGSEDSDEETSIGGSEDEGQVEEASEDDFAEEDAAPDESAAE